ncbi:MAG: Bug family tripartite tricarboxylate transporter substrate binding protein [Xanthobacteraceae bacterium]
MTIQRRHFLQLAAGAAAWPLLSQGVAAQSYPTRPIRLLVGFPAGGGVDIVARLMAQWLTERLGQPVVVENKPGAATNLATEAALKSPPDGYTLLVGFVTQAVNASLYPNLDYNFVRDSAPVASISRGALVMVVAPDFSAKTIKDFIDYAKANPGKINMGSGGVGSPPHVAAELFRWKTGIEMAHIPYRGDAPGLTDLMGGRVQVYFPGLASAVELIKGGKLRALGVTTEERSKVLPDVPAVGEVVPGYEASTWYGIVAPKGTPTEIVDKLNKEVNAALADPKVLARIASLGGVPMIGTPASFAKFIADETAKWAEVVKKAGIKAN